MVLENLDVHREQNEIDPYLTLYMEISSNKTKGLNVRAKTIQFWEERGNSFLDNDTWSMNNWEKTDKLDSSKWKALVYHRILQESEKATYKMEEIFQKLYGVVSRISTEPLQYNNKITTEKLLPIKNGQGDWINISLKEIKQMANKHKKRHSPSATEEI